MDSFFSQGQRVGVINEASTFYGLTGTVTETRADGVLVQFTGRDVPLSFHLSELAGCSCGNRGVCTVCVIDALNRGDL